MPRKEDNERAIQNGKQRTEMNTKRYKESARQSLKNGQLDESWFIRVKLRRTDSIQTHPAPASKAYGLIITVGFSIGRTYCSWEQLPMWAENHWQNLPNLQNEANQNRIQPAKGWRQIRKDGDRIDNPGLRRESEMHEQP
ncbi:hypothetical protein B0H14DRAFT_2577402 [Mycena olivaceomarginata]|nr:hypothetical protein B0H14DRAFT_2577402 [Mycena olivaceomarginata]